MSSRLNERSDVRIRTIACMLERHKCSCGLGHPQAQYLLEAIQVDANGQVQDLDPDCSVVAHLDVNAVHVDDGVQRIQWPRLPGSDLIHDGIGHR
jgi:hypothetical protein